MRRLGIVLVLFCFSAVFFGCNNGGGSDPSPVIAPNAGSMALQFDFNALLQSGASASLAAGAAPAPVISAVTVTVSRTGYVPIVKALAISNNIATGQIDGLDPGYWHVDVEVSSGPAIIYTGSSDVNVIAGVVVQCVILFNPIVQTPVTGGVLITVGSNPMPGYIPLSQTVSDLLFDRVNARLYLLDGSANKIGVYEADTLVRTKDLVLQAAPLSMALNSAATGIFLGYPSGHIRLLDIASGQDTLVADVLMQAQKMVALNDQFLAVAGPGAWDNDIKILNVSNGQVTATKSIFYMLTELLYNPQAKTVYSHHTGVSPTDIHYLKVDDAAGAFLSEGDSIYHGDYSFGLPLRLINNNTRLATSSGNMFTSAELVANDLRYSGSLGYSYIDLSSDDAGSRLYVLNNAGIQKLLVMDQTTYFLNLSIDLSGTPARVFNTTNSVIVLSTKDGKYYAKSFAKADLGL